MSKPPKRPSAEKLQSMVNDFNARFPIGTEVVRYAMIEPLSDGTPTKTTSQAWVMGGHSAMVVVHGFSGGQSLDAIRIL